MKIRFLPSLIAFSLVFLLTKIVNIMNGDINFGNKFFITDISLADNSPAKDSNNNSDHQTNNNDHNVSTKRPEEYNCNNPKFSEIELDILKNLAKRREQIEQWSNNVKEKESVLKAAEIKVDKKIEQLSILKDQVGELLKLYNEKEDIKINSLVQIYESMKPKDAAKIFESLDMTILLQVIDKMNKLKTAPILALMDPRIATDITTEFANQKKLPDQVTP